ncbi:MAG: rhodanese-like domain-containing protein [bacterium]|nr:rhodanese-like domain-containing protein [bacterium]
MNSYRVLSPTEMNDRLQSGRKVRLIDVRDFDEFQTVHVCGADCVPLPQLLKQASSWTTDEELTLICHSGSRACEAAGQLGEFGFEHLAVVEGGTQACVQAGVSVVRGRRRIPLQRQVLLGAGLVMLSGLALSFVHGAFIVICWFAASMLVAAGLSGFCPMAKILALAPWNRASAPVESSGKAECSVKGACS